MKGGEGKNKRIISVGSKMFEVFIFKILFQKLEICLRIEFEEKNEGENNRIIFDDQFA